MQNEITTRDDLLNNEGLLKHKGYAKFPQLRYNPEKMRVYPFRFLNRLRLKEWDYYGVTTKEFYFSATVSNIGYAGFVFVYFIDFKKKTMLAEEVTTPLGKGCRLPGTSEAGDIYFSHKNIKIEFKRLEDARAIKVDWPNFNNGKGISANLVARQAPTHESITVTTPIGKNRFYYNQKINCMPTQGKITSGNEEYEVTPQDALTTLDWGRGVWEYKSFWNWASASGFLPDGKTVGLNMGKGFGDLSYATENCFFIDGKMTKLEWVDIEYDSGDFMKPWSFISKDGKLELTFRPFFDRQAKTNVLIIRSSVHQLFGEYSGTLKTDDGVDITVDGLIGWAEEHKAYW